MPKVPLSWPLVTFSKLEWCSERQDFFSTCYRKRVKPANWRKFTYHIHPYAEYQDMKNYMIEANKKAAKWVPPDDPFLKDFPIIAELLTNPYFDDGKLRELCTFGPRWGLDSCQLNVSDRRFGATMSTTSTTLQGAMELMEEALRDGHNLWRPWRDWGNGKK